MPGDLMRPPNISEADWARMPWYAREKAVRRRSSTVRVTVEAMPRTTTRVKRRVRIYKRADGWWEMTNGVSTACTATAAGAWSLLAHLERTAS